MQSLELAGRAAVITGAASGIGRALAMEAAAHGMAVAIADVDAERLAETETILRERQVRVLAQVVDVRSAEVVEAFAAACFETFPSIATVWANAGINRYNAATAPDFTEWNLVIDVNLRGPLHCMGAFMPRLIAQGEPAQFVITGSQASFMAAPQIGAYAATKHALWAVAETLKLELAAQDGPVGISLLAPPRTATPIIANTVERVRASGGDEEAEAFLLSLPQPDEIARYALEKAQARDFLILPHFADIAAIVATRMLPLIKGEAM
jgi:NAD(P)-dependent dehydrogenase (short-subunit alcohol dehydrogenase family)